MKDIDMFSIAVAVLIMIVLLLTVGSVCVFQGQEVLEAEDLSEEDPFAARSLKNIDMMVEGGYYCLLSFEYIKKGKDRGSSRSEILEHFGDRTRE